MIGGGLGARMLFRRLTRSFFDMPILDSAKQDEKLSLQVQETL